MQSDLIYITILSHVHAWIYMGMFYSEVLKEWKVNRIIIYLRREKNENWGKRETKNWILTKIQFPSEFQFSYSHKIRKWHHVCFCFYSTFWFFKVTLLYCSWIHNKQIFQIITLDHEKPDMLINSRIPDNLLIILFLGVIFTAMEISK